MFAGAFKTIRRVLGIVVVAAAITAALPASSRAQQSVEIGLSRLINDMQTGHVNLHWFGPRMRNVIIAQTNGTLVYPQLAQLGPPVGIHVVSERQLPRGVIYGLRADFAQASVHWELAYDRASVIQAFTFQFVTPTSAPGGPPPQFPPQQQYQPPQQQTQEPPPEPPQQQTEEQPEPPQPTAPPVFSPPFPAPPQQQVASEPPPPPPPPAHTQQMSPPPQMLHLPTQNTGGTSTGGTTDNACKLYPNLC